MQTSLTLPLRRTGIENHLEPELKLRRYPALLVNQLGISYVVASQRNGPQFSSNNDGLHVCTFKSLVDSLVNLFTFR